MLIDMLPSDAPLIPFSPGKVIFSKGEAGDLMYVVIEGQAQIMIDGNVLEVVGSGGILGEMALIDAGPRSAAAVAKTQCVLVPLDERRFNHLVGNKPEFALHVMRVLANRLRRTNSSAR